MNEIQPSGNGHGRMPNGTFAKGNKLGKGNPRLPLVEQFRARLFRPQCLGTAVEKLRELVEQGDIEAIKLVLSYTLGKPVQPVAVAGELTTRYTITVELVQAAPDA